MQLTPETVARSVPAFQCGGTLLDSAVYLERSADRNLPALLLAGDLCYVLAPRQIGKSSLRVRVRHQLEAQGVRCAAIDLTGVGDRHTASEQWYFDLTSRIARQLRLADDPAIFWKQHAAESPLSRLLRYLRAEVLEQIPGQIVLFFDEIDATLTRAVLDRDAFFAALRHLYNARAEDAAYQRLTLCLLGVALPGDLIADELQTPFNVGRAIAVADFSRAELEQLRDSVTFLTADPSQLLDELFAAAHGHPYMTQRICALLTRKATAGQPIVVADAVQELFLRRGRVLESNLAYAAKWFERSAAARPRAARMLRLYGRIRHGEVIRASGQDETQLALRLTGMAVERVQDGQLLLQVRNPIFAEVFDSAWVREREKERWLAEPLRLWRESQQSLDYVLRGQALRDAQDWAKGRADLSPEEADFLFASREAGQTAERAAQRTRELRRNFGILLGLVAVLVLALLGALWQYRKAQRARQEAEQAQHVAELARLEEQGSRAVLLAKQPGQEREALQTALGALGADPDTHRLSAVRASGLTAAVRGAELLPTLRGHSGPVWTAAFLPDGKHVITTGADRTARLWSVGFARELPTIFRDPYYPSFDRRFMAVHKGSHLELWQLWPSIELRHRIPMAPNIDVSGVSASGEQLLSVQDGVAHVYAAQDGHELGAVHIPQPASVQLAPDGRRLVSWYKDQAVRIWDVQSGRASHVLQGPTGRVGWAEFSPDGTRLLTGGRDATVFLWDLRRQGSPPLALEGHSSLVMKGVFSADGRWALAGSEDQTAIVWDLADGQPLHIYRGHSEPLATAHFSPDSQYVVTPSWDQTVRLWSTRSDQPLAVLRGHRGGVYNAEFSADTNQVITAGEDHTIRIWDVPAGTLTEVLKGHTDGIHGVNLLPDGQHAWSSSTDGTARIWDTRRRELRRWQSKAKRLTALAVSPDGQRIAAGGADADGFLWRTDGIGLSQVFKGHRDALTVVEFSPDGTKFLTGSRDGVLRLYSADSGELLWATPKQSSPIFYAEFSRDGRLIVTICDGEQGLIWDANTGAALRELDRQPTGPLNVTGPYAAFSPDSQRVVTGRRDGAAKIWSVHGTEPPIELRGHEGAVVYVRFSKDGNRLLTAGHDATVRLWDVHERRELLRLVGHSAEISMAIFSPGEDRILTTSLDGTARLWDSKDGAQLFFVEGYFEYRGAAGFSPDGTKLIVTTQDDSAVIYPVSLNEQLRLGCQLLKNEQLDTQGLTYASRCAEKIAPQAK